MVPQIEPAIATHLIFDGQHTASELVRKMLEQINFTLNISDFATGGLLEATLKTPKTIAHLHFTHHEKNLPHITIKVLEEFWQGKDAIETTLTIDFNFTDKKDFIDATIPFHGLRVKQYAVEFICWKILLQTRPYY